MNYNIEMFPKLLKGMFSFDPDNKIFTFTENSIICKLQQHHFLLALFLFIS